MTINPKFFTEPASASAPDLDSEFDSMGTAPSADLDAEFDAHEQPAALAPFQPPHERGIESDWGPLNWVIDGLGWAGEKARGLGNAYADVVRPNEGTPEEGRAAVMEWAGRNMMVPFVGGKFVEDMPAHSKQVAVQKMGDVLGHKQYNVPGISGWPGNAGPVDPTTLASAAMQMPGQVPMMAVGLGWANKGMRSAEAIQAGGKVLPAVLKMVGGAAGTGAENVVLGGAQRAVQGEQQDPLTDLAMGAGLHTAGAGLQFGLGALKSAPKGSRAARFAELAEKDLLSWVKGEKTERVGALTSDGVDRLTQEIAADAKEVPVNEAKPSLIRLVRGVDGLPAAHVTELRTDGTINYYTLPIHNVDDALRVNKLRAQHNVALKYGPGGEELLKKSPDAIKQVINHLSKTRGSPLAGRAVKELVNLDEPAHVNDSGDVAIHVDPEGHVKLEPIPLQNEIETPEAGTTVKLPSGEQGVFQAIDPVSGNAIVHKAAGSDTPTGGAPMQVPPGDMTPLPPPSGPYTPKKGEMAYLKNPNGGYHVVEIVGKKGAQLEVTLGPNERPITVDPTHVEPRLPPGIQNIEELLPAKPEPLPPDAFSTMDPADLEEVNGARRVFENLSKKEPGLWERTMQKLLGGQVRGTKAMMMMHLRNQGSAALQKVGDDIVMAYQKLLPKGEQRTAFRNDLEHVMQGKKTWDAMTAKYGEAASQQLKDLTGNLMELRSQNDQRIAALEGIPDSLIAERAAGLVDPYLARMYMVNALPPGDWARIVSKQHPEVFAKAVDFLIQDLSQNGKFHVLPEQVSAELETILKAPNVTEALKASGLKEAKSFKRLLARQEIAPELRAVMGELTAGDIRMATSIGAQEAIIAKLELFSDISVDQNLSSIARRPDLHPVPVPDDKRFYGKLAGRYVKPEIFNELTNVPHAVRHSYTWANSVARWMKGNQLMSMGPFMTSLSGNVQGGIFSGGLSLYRPIKYGKDLHAAAKAIHDYHADPSGRTGNGWLVREAKKLGADYSGRGEVEISSSNRKFVRELMTTLEKQPQGGFSAIETLKTLVEKYGDVQGAFGNMLDLQDQLFRLASYKSLREKFIGQGMAPQEAGLTAAKRVVDSFPNPGNVGEGVAALRSAVGVAAPYLTPKAEDLRIWLGLRKRLMAEPDLKYRLMGNALVGAGIAGMMMHFSGVSRQSLDLAQESMTKRSKSFRHTLIPWVTRDANGRVQMIDATNWFMPAQLLSGHPDDAAFSRFAYNLASFPFEGGAIEDAMSSVAEAGGMKRPVGEIPLMEGEGTFGRMVDKTARLGFGPRALSLTQDLARKTQVGGTYEQPETLMGNMGRNEEPFTPGQALANAAGIKVQGAGQRGYRAATMEGVGEIRHLAGSELVRLFSSTRDPSEKKRIAGAIIERIKLLGSQRANASAAREASELAQFLGQQ